MNKCKPKNPLAVALGKLGKGKKKTLSDEQRKAAADRMAIAREKRHPKKKKKDSMKSA